MKNIKKIIVLVILFFAMHTSSSALSLDVRIYADREQLSNNRFI